MVTARSIYREALPVMLLSAAGGLFAGTVLGHDTMRHAIETVPGLLLMLPAIMAMRGNVFGAVGARLATGLHQGLIEPELKVQDRIVTVLKAAAINSVLTAVFIATTSYAIVTLLGLGEASLLQLLGIALIATVLSGFTLITLLLAALYIGYRRGIDPDVIFGPVVTTAGDIFEIVYLAVAVGIIGVIL